MTSTLLLNADYLPLKLISWERAICLVLEGKARLVEASERMVRSQRLELALPSVVALVRHVQVQHKVRFNRRNVLARDLWTCGYCGVEKSIPDLTLDHVVPRAQSKRGRVRLPTGKSVAVTSWENIVTACWPCNMTKADRTPAEAGMPLAAWPRRPGPWTILRMSLQDDRIPQEWRAYVPEGAAGWDRYWDVELDAA